MSRVGEKGVNEDARAEGEKERETSRELHKGREWSYRHGTGIRCWRLTRDSEHDDEHDDEREKQVERESA